jgi:hypothetical protein
MAVKTMHMHIPCPGSLLRVESESLDRLVHAILDRACVICDAFLACLQLASI